MKNPCKVTIGITTYNRKKVLEQMAKSLYQSDMSGAQVSVRIYDDKSTEFDEGFLWRLFPDAVSIIVNEENKRSDLNIFSMYCDFLNTDDDYFFNADSDLIFNKEWLSFILENFDKTDGILSVFNTDNHPVLKDDACPLFVQKMDIGSAGTFFSRARVEQIVAFTEAKRDLHLDWNFCSRFVEQGVRILCSRQSYVQHIGLKGQNSVSCIADYGERFVVDSLTNGQILNDVLLDLTKENGDENRRFIERRIDLILNKSVEYRIGRLLLRPFRLMRRVSRRLWTMRPHASR